MRILIMAAIGLAIADPAGARAADDVAAIKSAFRAYQTALVKKDGARCVAVVDRGTIDYYQRMRDLAVTGKADEIKKLPMLDKLMIIRMRLQVPTADLKRMDGRAALAHGVTAGWVGSNVRKITPGAVDVTGDRASVAFVVDGKPTPVKLTLRRDSGAWRVDLVSLFQMSNDAFRKQQEASGMSEDDFLLSLLADVAGKPVPPTIWDPPK